MKTVSCNFIFFHCGHSHPVQLRKDRLVDPMLNHEKSDMVTEPTVKKNMELQQIVFIIILRQNKCFLLIKK